MEQAPRVLDEVRPVRPSVLDVRNVLLAIGPLPVSEINRLINKTDMAASKTTLGYGGLCWLSEFGCTQATPVSTR